MGSMIEINDTLQVTKEQGFPAELDIEQHLQKPYEAKDFADKIYQFKNKPGIRLFHQPPIRIFLAENINGKWLYWGKAHIVSVSLDYINKTTSGEYKIISINSPEEMKTAFDLIDGRPDFNYFQ